MAEGAVRETVQCSFEASQTHQLPCDAAGVATRLSTGREGIETPTGRHHRRQHWCAALFYKQGQRTAVDGTGSIPWPPTNMEKGGRHASASRTCLECRLP